ncbi:MAG: polysaccharide deacetylase family protein [Bryobacteraceae bacterium]|nr:polysaccharide deacetylase family protein [Bryobacteraceae bacterium]
MIFCATVDDVCYEGYSTEAHLTNLLALFQELGLPATLFTVPLAQGIPLGERSGYVDILKQAASGGHEVAQHGLEHDRFECGVPPRMIMDLPHEGPARERLARERDAIEAALTTPAIRQRLAQGRRIIEDALEIRIAGFRAPCLSICDNLFHALDQEGYLYDSSRHLQEAGWDLLNGVRPAIPRPITREIYDRLQYPGRLRTLPLTAEYTWYLTWENFDVTMDLAQHDFRACLDAGIPFVPICHVSPIQQGEDECGFEFYRRLADFARAEAGRRGEDLEALTLAAAAAKAPSATRAEASVQ